MLYELFDKIPQSYQIAISSTTIIVSVWFSFYGCYIYGNWTESANILKDLPDADSTTAREVLSLLSRILLNNEVKALIKKAQNQRDSLSPPEIFHFEFEGSEQELNYYKSLEFAFSRALSLLDSSDLSYLQARKILYVVLPNASAFGFETFRKSLSLGIMAAYITKNYEFLLHCAKLKVIMHTESLSQYHYYLSGDDFDFISRAEKCLNQTFENYLYSNNL